MSDDYNIIKRVRSFEKLKELDAYFDRQLQKSRSSKTTSQDNFPASVKRWSARLCAFFVLMVLPFFVLVRTSVYLYSTFQLNSWLALAGGIAATVFLLLTYVFMVNYRIMRKRMRSKYLLNGISLLVVAYCCYGLLYFSGMNVKNQEIRSYYHKLHPILRITLTTTTLADQQLIITDMQRFPEDYATMGLPVNEQSLHYVQESGYVHAVDIRTRGRAGWKNWLIQSMFRLAGLQIIRHAGTADHLHVSLPLNK